MYRLFSLSLIPKQYSLTTIYTAFTLQWIVNTLEIILGGRQCAGMKHILAKHSITELHPQLLEPSTYMQGPMEAMCKYYAIYLETGASRLWYLGGSWNQSPGPEGGLSISIDSWMFTYLELRLSTTVYFAVHIVPALATGNSLIGSNLFHISVFSFLFWWSQNLILKNFYFWEISWALSFIMPSLLVTLLPWALAPSQLIFFISHTYIHL